MENKERVNREYYTIDILHVMRELWNKVWMIIISAVLAAGVGFSIAAFIITPKYSSSILLYVNNSSFSLGNTSFSISSSEITAAQSLVKTYSEILTNRTTLERIIDKTNVDYNYKELAKMIVAAPSNETEIMRVTVTGTDPYEASRIANCVAEVLPVRIAEIIDGASMEVVDSAIPNLEKISPSITRYTAIGLIIGLLLSIASISVAAILDDTIHSEDYILETYDYPILAKIPDLLSDSKGKYGYYYSRRTPKKN